MSDPELRALRNKVTAAQEEFAQAVAYHEAWKPAAFDQALLARMGTSYASNTFLIIRAALRREMLLALLRMWDRDRRAVSLPNIARSLSSGRIVDRLVAECEDHWVGLASLPRPDIEGHHPSAERLIRASQVDFARRQGDAIRSSSAQVIERISKYVQGDQRIGTLSKLFSLRDQMLAHRQVQPILSIAAPAGPGDEEIEEFFQDMGGIVRLLMHAVANTDYQPDETAEIHARHARLFWAPVCGERTPGHPAFIRAAQSDPPE